MNPNKNREAQHTIEPKQATLHDKATERVPQSRDVALVKNWIYELKLHSRQERRFTLPLPNTA